MSPRATAFDAEALVSLHRVTAAVPSPDGTWVAVAVSRLDTARAKYVSDLWRVPLEPGTDAPVRLTRGDANDRAPCFRRDGSLGFLSNRNPRDGAAEPGDDQRAQVWLLPAQGGEPVPLTDEPLGVTAFRFATQADVLLVQADVLPGIAHDQQRARAQDRARNGPTLLRYDTMPVRHWDTWLPEAAPHLIAYDAQGLGRHDLTPTADREHRESGWDIAADGTFVIVTSVTTGIDRIHDSALVHIDVANGTTRILGRESRVALSTPRIAPDGRHIACLRHQRIDGRHGEIRAVLIDAITGSARTLADAWDRWPVLGDFTADGTKLIVTADDHASVPVFAIDLADDTVTRITSVSSGGSHADLALVPGRDEIVGTRSRMHHPPEPFRVACSHESVPGLLARLSGFDEDDGRAIASWQSIDVPSTDGEAVQTLLATPASHRAEDTPLPTLLWIHGGPRGQWADGWHWRWNPLVAVARGFAVALPNPRGSTGNGQAFIEAVSGNRWGDQVYRDILSVTDALSDRSVCDETRMAAMGGSFGGYMVSWIGANTTRFRALVTHAGLYALSSFHGVTDVPAWWTHDMGGAPWAQDPSVYDRYSPHRGIARWKTPTLVVHGERDYRVPISEALALFEALQAHGVPSELAVFPDENHWILRPRNTVAWYGATLAWVERWMEAGEKSR